MSKIDRLSLIIEELFISNTLAPSNATIHTHKRVFTESTLELVSKTNRNIVLHFSQNERIYICLCWNLKHYLDRVGIVGPLRKSLTFVWKMPECHCQPLPKITSE